MGTNYLELMQESEETYRQRYRDLQSINWYFYELVDKAEKALYRLQYLEESIEIYRGGALKIEKLVDDLDAIEFKDLYDAIAELKGEPKWHDRDKK